MDFIDLFEDDHLSESEMLKWKKKVSLITD